MKNIIGEAFKGTVIKRDGDYVIIKAKIPKELKVGFPCRINPYKFENEKERETWDKSE